MTVPLQPARPSLELTLAKQANEAIENGVNPHAATEMLGKMLTHLKQNPELSAHGAEALANGVDPHAISAKLWEMANSPAVAAQRKPLIARAGEMIANTASQIAAHPLDAAVSLVTSPIKAAYTAAVAPSVGEGRPDARLSKGGNSTGRAIDTTPYDAEHGGVTPRERNAAGIATLGTAAFPVVAAGLSRSLVQAGVNRALAKAVGVTAGGAILGAATNPNDPVAGGLAGAGTAAVIGGVAPQVGRLVKSVGSGTISTLGLRPSGLTAEEMAADAAASRAPIGLQASRTPSADAIINRPQARTDGGAVLQPSTVQRARAAGGRLIAGAGVEPTTTRALRLFAERANLDNVTREDALAFADRAGDKPVAVLDLGGGNVAGLARTAKDVPSLARRQIPQFLNERSAGTFGNEGPTLQRITSDFENRIGLAPEDYFKSADEMTAAMKQRAASDYGKIRNTVIDDPDALSLFNEPEFRAVHEKVRANARIGMREQIPPLTSKETIGGVESQTLNPQTLGTLDKVKRQLDAIISGKSEAVGPVDRDMAHSMRARLNEILDNIDQQVPEYGAARSQYRGSAEAIDAFERGKSEFMNTDPRLLKQTVDQLPDRLKDLYRRGAYDALRSRLVKMKDGANIGGWLEDNPDIRDRVAALSKNSNDASALRGDLGLERAMGERKNFILGGPNSSERMIDYIETAKPPKVTQLGNVARHVPWVGKATGGLVDNAVTRRSADQTGAVMGEVGKIMTRTGRSGIQQTFDDLSPLEQADRQRRMLREALAREFAAAGARAPSAARPR